MRRLVLVLIACGTLALVATPMAAYGQEQDSAVGAGTFSPDGFWTNAFDFAATSGPSGENATGHYEFSLSTPDGDFVFGPAGPVTCLNVYDSPDDTNATIGGPDTSGQYPGMYVYFNVEDNSPSNPEPDRIGSKWITSVPPDCSAQNPGGFDVLTGFIEILDDQLVTPVAECSDLADNDGDGKTDFPADPGCESATDDSESPDPPPPVPTTKDDCKNGGWRNYPHLGFKNQGDCVSYVSTHGNNEPGKNNP